MTGIQILVGALGYFHNHVVMYRSNTPTQTQTGTCMILWLTKLQRNNFICEHLGFPPSVSVHQC